MASRSLPSAKWLLAPAKKTETSPSWRFVLPLVLALLIFAAVSFLQGGPWSSAENDFLPFYCAGKLQPSGDLYHFDKYYDLQRQILGGVSPALVYIRLPFYALAFVPLAQLPYLAAYAVYLALQLTVFSVWLRSCWVSHPKLALSAAVSLPLLLAFGNGQDVILITALAGLAWQESGRRPFLAGLLLALCSIKIHLFLLVPLALLRHRYWRTLGGLFTGGGVLIALSFFAAGRNWVQEYSHILSRPEIHPQVKLMGNLRTLAAALGFENAAWVLIAGTALLTLRLLWQSRNLTEALLVALSAALILNPHVYLQDFTLLLSLVPLASAIQFRVWQERAWKLVLSPIPYLAALPGPPFSALLPASVLAMLVTSIRTETASRPQAL